MIIFLGETTFQQFVDMTEAFPWMIWLSDGDPSVRWMNKAFRDFGGLTTDERSGKTWISRIHQDDLTRYRGIIADATRDKVKYSCSYRYESRSGGHTLVHERGYPCLNNHETLAGYVGFCTCHDSFQPSPTSDEFSTISDMPVPVLVWDTNLMIHRLNDEAERLFATNSAVACGKSLSNVTGIDRNTLLRIQETLLTLNRSEVQTSKDILIDISGRFFNWHNRLIKDHKRDIPRIVSVVMEVTDRKSHPAISSSAQEHFYLATAKTRCMVYEWRRDKAQVSRSQGIFDLVGYMPEELPPTVEAWEQLIHPEDLELFKNVFFQTVADRHKLVDSHYRVLHRNGSIRYIWDRAIVDYEDDGTPLRISGFSTDVTESTITQKDLQQIKEQLQAITETIEGMVYQWNLNDGTVMRSKGVEYLNGTQSDHIPTDTEWWLAMVHHDDRSRYRSFFEHCIQQRRECASIDYRLDHIGQGYVEVIERCRIIYNNSGEAIQIVGCVSLAARDQINEIAHQDTSRTSNPVTTTQTNRSRLRVLVVDDYPNSADSLGKLLDLLGHQTDVAYDGDGAIQLIAEITYDIVFLDLGLPKVSGYDVARQIRRIRQDDTIIAALTGWGDAQSRTRSIESGINYHFTKPISDSDLDHVLEAALRKKTC